MKKTLLIAAALVSAFTFFGCKEEEGETGKIGKDFELSNTNPGQYLRGFTTTSTKHTSATAKITLGADASGSGIVGFIFGVNEKKDAAGKKLDSVYDFGIIGLRRELDTKIGYYVSTFEDVYTKEDFLNKSNSFQKQDGTKAKENAIDPTSDVTTALADTAVKGEAYKVWVVLEATGPDTDGNGKVKDGEGDGGYKVTFYKNAPDAKGKDTKGDLIKSVTIPTSATPDDKATQHYLGLYTNVYGGTKENPTVLKGRLDLSDYVNGVEVEITD